MKFGCEIVKAFLYIFVSKFNENKGFKKFDYFKFDFWWIFGMHSVLELELAKNICILGYYE